MASVQALLENGKGEVRLQVAAHCKRTIEGSSSQSYTEQGELPDKDVGYDHMNDALGYLVFREFSILHARAGRGTGIRLTKLWLLSRAGRIHRLQVVASVHQALRLLVTRITHT